MEPTETSAGDRSLAHHPWHAAFFPMVALFAYSIIIFTVAGGLIPAVSAAARGEGEHALVIGWGMQASVQIAMFAHMTYWAAAIGAGPFAGEIRTKMKWFAVAIFLGPLIQTAAFTFAYVFIAGGEDNWAVRDDLTREALSAAALGPMMILSLVFLAPIVEETAFRGIALGHLIGRGISLPVAIGMQAAGFALIHLQYTPAALFAVFILGLFLGWLRVASKSVGPPILAHMAINTQALIEITASGG